MSQLEFTRKVILSLATATVATTVFAAACGGEDPETKKNGTGGTSSAGTTSTGGTSAAGTTSAGGTSAAGTTSAGGTSGGTTSAGGTTGGTSAGGTSGGTTAGGTSAGGSSGGTTASPNAERCEHYCEIYETKCPTNFAADYTDDCQSTCEGFTLGTDGDLDGETIECRITHITNSGADNDVHCTEGQKVPALGCLD